jgi:hypothetical protein
VTGRFFDLLPKVAERRAPGLDGPGIRLNRPGNGSQQCGFSGAVRTDQTDSMVVPNGPGDVVKDLLATERE